MKKHDLVKIISGKWRSLIGEYGRVTEVKGDSVYLRVEGAKKLFGTHDLKTAAKHLRVVVSGGATNGLLTLCVWEYLYTTEKARIIKDKLAYHRDQAWYQDFEKYILRDESLVLLDEFIAITKSRMTTHNHYGSKAIFEHLRYHSEAKDSDAMFKINNNYTGSVARLVNVLFPETNGFFEKRSAA